MESREGKGREKRERKGEEGKGREGNRRGGKGGKGRDMGAPKFISGYSCYCSTYTVGYSAPSG